ncbi:MAG: hypothetical protein RMJ17_03215 [Candidatus Aenigmarchaeota archaeon]|nr:hypothetical protein [Candidatus Aenigmarchaeota archaeon]MDW8149576.1 hypothetical protein [Candidatus Aenigmarchaeota archaeon]
MPLKGQAKIDEFIWVFFTGMLTIIILLFFWGTPRVGVNETENFTQAREIFTIGTFDEDVPRSIRIGDFTTSHTAGSQTIETRKYIEVSRGLFENKKFSFSAEIADNLDNVIDGWVELYVLESGNGKIIVRVNDEVVYSQKANPGKIKIPVERSILKSYNVIEISSSMPGLQFWSTNIYNIEKVEFGINIYGNVIKRYDFLLYGSELKSFSRGEVKFNVEEREGTGDLIIKINGKEFFRGIPSGSFSKTFEIFDVGLVNGVNTIEFYTERDTSYKLDDVQIIITHREQATKSRAFSFKITDEDMEKLERGKKGRISFTILDTDFNGNLAIKIKDASGKENQLDYISSYAIGKSLSVNFGPNDVKVGTNYVIFTVIGHGRFTLSNMEVVI